VSFCSSNALFVALCLKDVVLVAVFVLLFLLCMLFEVRSALHSKFPYSQVAAELAMCLESLAAAQCVRDTFTGLLAEVLDNAPTEASLHNFSEGHWQGGARSGPVAEQIGHSQSLVVIHPLFVVGADDVRG
jgi:hypothetical protein